MLRGAPTRRASEKVGSNKTKSDMILSQKKNAKILKNFYNSNGTPVVTSSDDSLLTSVPLKKPSVFCWLHF